MTTPAIIYIVCTLITVLIWASLHDQMVRVNVWTKIADASLIAAVLYWGGFFS